MNSYFNLNSFIDSYITFALEYAEESPTLENFDCSIRKKLSNSFNLLEKEVINIHHPFHWALFCDKDVSILETFSGEEKDFPMRVRPRRKICSEDRSRIIKHIHKHYLPYLQRRINLSSEDNLPVPA
jgi:hypothetical protein